MLDQNLTPAQTDQLTEIEAWVVSWGGQVSVVSQPHSMSVTVDLISGCTLFGGSQNSDSGMTKATVAPDGGTGAEA